MKKKRSSSELPRSSIRRSRTRIIDSIFGLDLRSLALFRVGLAGFTIYDLIHRAFDLTAHYTDAGIVPRDFLLNNLWDPHAFSLHMMTGTTVGIAVLFFIHLIAATGLLVGYRTRLMTFVVWLLTSSLDTRNPLILNGGDDLMRVLLFFAIFLPLGARYSLDAALDSSRGETTGDTVYTSPSTAVYYLQIICVYFFAALLKSGPEWRSQGTAVYYALSLDQLALPLGKVLLGFPAAMKALTFAVWWIELLGGFVFLIPHPLAKLAGIVLIAGLQIGFGSTLAIGHFPWVNGIALLPFIPSLVWDRVKPRKAVRIIFDPDCGFCRKMVIIIVEFLRPQLDTALQPAAGKDLASLRKHHSWIVRRADCPEQSFFEFEAFHQVVRSSAIFFWTAPLLGLRPIRASGAMAYRFIANRRHFFATVVSPLKFRKFRLRTYWWREALVVFFFTGVLINNLAPLAPVDTLNKLFNVPIMLTRLDEYWGMFAPAPTHDDGWYVIEGRLQNGTIVDAFRQTIPIRYDEPGSAAKFYPNERWRKFMMNIWLRAYKNFRAPLARYLCSAWNRNHSEQVHMDRLTIYFMLKVTPPPGGRTNVQKLMLGDYPCVGTGL